MERFVLHRFGPADPRWVGDQELTEKYKITPERALSFETVPATRLEHRHGAVATLDVATPLWTFSAVRPDDDSFSPDFVRTDHDVATLRSDDALDAWLNATRDHLIPACDALAKSQGRDIEADLARKATSYKGDFVYKHVERTAINPDFDETLYLNAARARWAVIAELSVDDVDRVQLWSGLPKFGSSGMPLRAPNPVEAWMAIGTVFDEDLLTSIANSEEWSREYNQPDWFMHASTYASRIMELKKPQPVLVPAGGHTLRVRGYALSASNRRRRLRVGAKITMAWEDKAVHWAKTARYLTRGVGSPLSVIGRPTRLRAKVPYYCLLLRQFSRYRVGDRRGRARAFSLDVKNLDASQSIRHKKIQHRAMREFAPSWARDAIDAQLFSDLLPEITPSFDLSRRIVGVRGDRMLPDAMEAGDGTKTGKWLTTELATAETETAVIACEAEDDSFEACLVAARALLRPGPRRAALAGARTIDYADALALAEEEGVPPCRIVQGDDTVVLTHKTPEHYTKTFLRLGMTVTLEDVLMYLMGLYPDDWEVLLLQDWAYILGVGPAGRKNVKSAVEEWPTTGDIAIGRAARAQADRMRTSLIRPVLAPALRRCLAPLHWVQETGADPLDADDIELKCGAAIAKFERRVRQSPRMVEELIREHLARDIEPPPWLAAAYDSTIEGVHDAFVACLSYVRTASPPERRAMRRWCERRISANTPMEVAPDLELLRLPGPFRTLAELITK